MGVLDLLLFGLERFDMYPLFICDRRIDRENPIKSVEVELMCIGLDLDPLPAVLSDPCGYGFEFFDYQTIKLRGVVRNPS